MGKGKSIEGVGVMLARCMGKLYWIASDYEESIEPH
jgi:hypothetical protein